MAIEMQSKIKRLIIKMMKNSYCWRYRFSTHVRFALSTKGEWGLSDDSKIENVKINLTQHQLKRKVFDLDDDGEETCSYR